MSTTTITVSTRADIAPPARRCERPDVPDTPPERPFLVGARPVEGSHRARRLLRLSRMNPGAPLAPRTLFRALVTRALGEGGFHSAASLLLSPLSALAPEDEVWVSSAADFDAKAPHPTPVVLVHGFLGNPGHFRFLRRFLVARGFHNFATFSYAPRVDHQELARRLGRAIEAVCEAAGRAEVDVVGYSLGGLVARHLRERGGAALSASVPRPPPARRSASRGDGPETNARRDARRGSSPARAPRPCGRGGGCRCSR